MSLFLQWEKDLEIIRNCLAQKVKIVRRFGDSVRATGYSSFKKRERKSET